MSGPEVAADGVDAALAVYAKEVCGEGAIVIGSATVLAVQVIAHDGTMRTEYADHYTRGILHHEAVGLVTVHARKLETV